MNEKIDGVQADWTHCCKCGERMLALVTDLTKKVTCVDCVKTNLSFVDSEVAENTEIIRVFAAYHHLSRQRKLDILETLGDWIDKEVKKL